MTTNQDEMQSIRLNDTLTRGLMSNHFDWLCSTPQGRALCDVSGGHADLAKPSVSTCLPQLNQSECSLRRNHLIFSKK